RPCRRRHRDGEAVSLRQHDVEHDEVVRRGSLGGDVDSVTLLPLVLDDEDPHASSVSPGSLLGVAAHPRANPLSAVPPVVSEFLDTWREQWVGAEIALVSSAPWTNLLRAATSLRRSSVGRSVCESSARWPRSRRSRSSKAGSHGRCPGTSGCSAIWSSSTRRCPTGSTRSASCRGLRAIAACARS